MIDIITRMYPGTTGHRVLDSVFLSNVIAEEIHQIKNVQSAK